MPTPRRTRPSRRLRTKFAGHRGHARADDHPGIGAAGLRRRPLLCRPAQRLLGDVVQYVYREAGLRQNGAGLVGGQKRAGLGGLRPGYGIHRFRITVGGERIVEGEASAGLQHAAQLAIKRFSIGDVHRDVLRPDEVELGILEWQPHKVALTELHEVGQMRAVGQHPGNRYIIGRQVDAFHPAAEGFAKVARRSAETGARVEHPRFGVDADPFSKRDGRGQPAHVKLVERRKTAGVDRRFHRVDRRGDAVEQFVPAGDGGLVVITDDVGLRGHAGSLSRMAGRASRAEIERSART